MSALAVPVAVTIVNIGATIVQIGVMVTAAVALVHAILARAESFAAAGKLSKPAWIGINAASIVAGYLSFFQIIAITAVLVYLLDVRPALREVSEGGSSPW